jgi:hypothetical protein
MTAYGLYIREDDVIWDEEFEPEFNVGSAPVEPPFGLMESWRVDQALAGIVGALGRKTKSKVGGLKTPVQIVDKLF